MRIAKSTLFIVSVLSLAAFLIAHQMTPTPGSTSGNGNPALLLVFLLIPLFVVMVLLWVRIFNVHSFSNITFVISIIVILIHLTAAFIYQRLKFVEYRQLIEDALLKTDGVADAEYLQIITSVLSIHVNNQYFNINTYFMFVTSSILIAILYTVWERKEKENWEKETVSSNSSSD